MVVESEMTPTLVTEVDPEPSKDPSLPKTKVLEQWMMQAAQDADQPAQVLRGLLKQNPAFGAYMAGDQELGGLVRLFAKRFRAKIMVAETPIRQETLFQPLCEVCWRTVGLVLKSLMTLNDNDTRSLPLSKDAQGQLKMLLNTNAELSRKLSESRRDYLRELSQHRDQQRRMAPRVHDMLNSLREEPIMFYEPLSFVLDETTKDFVRLIVEERVKLGMRTLIEAALKDEESEEALRSELETKLSKAEQTMRTLRNQAAREADAKERAEVLIEQLQRKVEAVQRERAEQEHVKEELSAKVSSLEKEITAAQASAENLHPSKRFTRKEEMKYVQELNTSLQEAHNTIDDLKLQVEKLQRLDRQHQHVLLATSGALGNLKEREKEQRAPTKREDRGKREPTKDQRQPAGKYDEAARKEVQTLKKAQQVNEARIRELEREVEDFKDRFKHMVLQDKVEEELQKAGSDHRAALDAKQEEINGLVAALEAERAKVALAQASQKSDPKIEASSESSDGKDDTAGSEAATQELRVKLEVSEKRCEELEENANDLQIDNEKLEAKVKVLMEAVAGTPAEDKVQEQLRSIEASLPQAKKRGGRKKLKAFERLYTDAQRRIVDSKQRQGLFEEAKARARQSTADVLRRRCTGRTEQILINLQRASEAASQMQDSAHGGRGDRDRQPPSGLQGQSSEPEGVEGEDDDDDEEDNEQMEAEAPLDQPGLSQDVLEAITALLLRVQESMTQESESADNPTPSEMLHAVFDCLAMVLQGYEGYADGDQDDEETPTILPQLNPQSQLQDNPAQRRVSISVPALNRASTISVISTHRVSLSNAPSQRSSVSTAGPVRRVSISGLPAYRRSMSGVASHRLSLNAVAAAQAVAQTLAAGMPTLSLPSNLRSQSRAASPQTSVRAASHDKEKRLASAGKQTWIASKEEGEPVQRGALAQRRFSPGLPQNTPAYGGLPPWRMPTFDKEATAFTSPVASCPCAPVPSAAAAAGGAVNSPPVDSGQQRKSQELDPPKALPRDPPWQTNTSACQLRGPVLSTTPGQQLISEREDALQPQSQQQQWQHQQQQQPQQQQPLSQQQQHQQQKQQQQLQQQQLQQQPEPQKIVKTVSGLWEAGATDSESISRPSTAPIRSPLSKSPQCSRPGSQQSQRANMTAGGSGNAWRVHTSSFIPDDSPSLLLEHPRSNPAIVQRSSHEMQRASSATSRSPSRTGFRQEKTTFVRESSEPSGPFNMSMSGRGLSAAALRSKGAENELYGGGGASNDHGHPPERGVPQGKVNHGSPSKSNDKDALSSSQQRPSSQQEASTERLRDQSDAAGRRPRSQPSRGDAEGLKAHSTGQQQGAGHMTRHASHGGARERPVSQHASPSSSNNAHGKNPISAMRSMKDLQAPSHGLSLGSALKGGAGAASAGSPTASGPQTKSSGSRKPLPKLEEPRQVPQPAT